MPQKKRLQLALLGVVLVVVVMAGVFQKQIRIAYHTSRLRASGRYLLLANRSLAANPPKLLNFLEEQLIRLGHGSQKEELETIHQHTQALMDMGYLIREEFPLRNRFYDGTNRVIFFQQMTNVFAFGTWEAVEKDDFWDMSGTESNMIVITTTRALMPKWRKLVKDFDRP